MNGSVPGLSKAAIEALETTGRTAVPRQTVNPGVVRRLLKEALVETFTAPTPFKTRSGNIEWLRITPAGRARLAGER